MAIEIVDFPINSMVIFKLPEGTVSHNYHNSPIIIFDVSTKF